MKLIRVLLRQSWLTVMLATLIGLLAGASSASLIAMINFALQRLDQLPAWLPWAFIGLCCLLMVTYATSQMLLVTMAQAIVYQLRLKLTQRILDCPLQQLEKLGAPRLLATLTEDVEAIANASSTLSILSNNLALTLCCLLYLCWLSPLLLLLVLVFLILSVALMQFGIIQGNQAFRVAREVQDRLYQHYQAVTAGSKELKLHYPRRQAFLTEDLEPTASDVRRAWSRGMFVFAVVGGLGLALIFFPIGFLLFVVPNFLSISASLLASFALTILFMVTPLNSILTFLPQLIQGNVALAKVDALGLSLAAPTTDFNLDQLPVANRSACQPVADGWQAGNGRVQSFSYPEAEYQERSQGDACPRSSAPSWQRLSLEGITHTYGSEREDHQFTLGPLNLQFQPGEIVFIVGGNGSGKSTLVKLITGLYIPEVGQVRLDGEVIGERNRERYRQQFSAVFADFYLFERFLGLDSDRLDNKAQGYLTQLELDHKVKLEDHRLSTLNLSQGQRKRLALLTAYLEDRPIYVFDEWASDQDPIFKQVFYTQLVPALKQQGKTVLVVSHDDRYFDWGDRTIKLDYGQVVAG